MTTCSNASWWCELCAETTTQLVGMLPKILLLLLLQRWRFCGGPMELLQGLQPNSCMCRRLRALVLIYCMLVGWHTIYYCMTINSNASWWCELSEGGECYIACVKEVSVTLRIGVQFNDIGDALLGQVPRRQDDHALNKRARPRTLSQTAKQGMLVIKCMFCCHLSYCK